MIRTLYPIDVLKVIYVKDNVTMCHQRNHFLKLNSMIKLTVYQFFSNDSAIYDSK